MFPNVLKWIMPARRSRKKPPRRKVKAAERISGNTFAPTADKSASGPRVLIADLDGDAGGKVTASLTEMLDRSEAFEIFRANQPLKQARAGDMVLRLIAAAAEGHAWMIEQSADLLVWGEIEMGTAVLRFLPLIPSGDNLPGAVGLGDSLDLPVDFEASLTPLLRTTVLAAVGPTFRAMRGPVAEALQIGLDETAGVLKEIPAGMTSGQYATSLACLGNACGAAYRLGGGLARLDQAIAAYRSALKKIVAAEMPVAWAVTQSHLAATLKAKGEKSDADETLIEAVAAYKLITETLSRGTHAFDWALAQANLGLVYYRLGTRSGRGGYLNEAGKAFEEALTVYKKETMPVRWGEISNQYGVVLMALGEQVTGNVVLELAVKRFRKALEVRKREQAPLLWAQTVNNLGAACFGLAKRNGEVALMREAITCFEGAVEIYTQSGATKKAEIIRNNLSRVERLAQTRGG